MAVLTSKFGPLVNSQTELDSLCQTIDLNFDLKNDIVLDDLWVKEGEVLTKAQVDKLRHTINARIDELVILVRLQERLKQIKVI